MLEPKVSGISTNAALLSKHGAQLVHHYQVFGDCVVHASLHGSFMIDPGELPVDCFPSADSSAVT